MYNAKLDKKDVFLRNLMLENMRQRSREVAEAHLNINGHQWPKDLEKVCQTLANFTTPDTQPSISFKRQRLDDQPRQQGNFNSFKKPKNKSGRQPSDCSHCWNHECKRVPFSKDLQCPHHPYKGRANKNCAACQAKKEISMPIPHFEHRQVIIYA